MEQTEVSSCTISNSLGSLFRPLFRSVLCNLADPENSHKESEKVHLPQKCNRKMGKRGLEKFYAWFRWGCWITQSTPLDPPLNYKPLLMCKYIWLIGISAVRIHQFVGVSDHLDSPSIQTFAAKKSLDKAIKYVFHSNQYHRRRTSAEMLKKKTLCSN